MQPDCRYSLWSKVVNFSALGKLIVCVIMIKKKTKTHQLEDGDLNEQEAPKNKKHLFSRPMGLQ